jgi:RimJ/RimL family protein N-acetyltransferase
MRLVALVERWTRTGDPVTVVGPAPASALGHRVEAAGGVVVAAVGDAGSAEDIAQVVALSCAGAAAWVVVDGAPFGPAFQEAVATSGARVLVVDDHGRHGRYRADLVLDQNPGGVEGYRDRGSARLLRGPAYALLRDEVSRLAARPISDPARVVLVTLGGEPTARVRSLGDEVAARISGSRPELEVDGPVPADDAPRTWAERLARADVVVSAAGSTVWELCHLGLPSVLVGVAADQVPVGEAMDAAGAAEWLGDLDEDVAVRAAGRALALAADPDLRRARSAAARSLVDGRGAPRVLAELRAPLLHLRAAQATDAELLWAWANDPVTRASSFDPDPIPWPDHERWLDSRLADPASPLFVAEGLGGAPVGLVRFDVSEDGPEIGVTVAPEARGAGVAAPLVLAGCLRMASEGAATVHAHIRPDNEGSLAAFRAAGFEGGDRTLRKGVVACHLRWSSDRAR